MSNDQLHIFTSTMDRLKPVFCQGRVVYKQVEKVRNFLRQHMGEEYVDFFAEPAVPDPYQVTDKGSWQTPLTSEGLITLEELEAKGGSSKFQEKLGALVVLCNQLQKSSNPEERNWAELLKACLVVPDKHHILINKDQGSLVSWGFEWSDRSKRALSLSKDIQFVNPKNTVTEEKNKEAHFLTQSSENTNQNVGTNSKPNLPSAETKVLTEGSSTTTSQNTGAADSTTNTPTTKTSDSGGNSGNNSKPDFWSRFKKYLWWILLLLFVLLFLFFISTCNSKTRLLPAKPGVIVPIDTTKIINDTSSHSYIVSNRLNVALVGDNKSIDDFAKKFKSLYPGNDYLIIYFDTTVHRVQIQVPDNKRETMKQELKTKMKDFKLLIWNESLFKGSRTPSDDAFNDIEKSWYMTRIGAQDAWDVTMGDSNLIIAVIDDGFDLNHDELKGKIVSPWNVVSGNSDVNTGKESVHGTHVAGTALGNADNLAGLSGVAPHCKFMPVQVGDYNGKLASTAIIDGVIYAINHGANVINMSLGMMFSKEVESLPPQEQMELIKTKFKEEEQFWTELFSQAAEKNIVVVLAGGNENILVGVDPMNRSPYVINVSAVDPKDQKASFSNYGPYSTISAPGVHIFNSIPGESYTFMDGTSMASPIVAGAVALIKSVNPSMSVSQIVDLIQSTGAPARGGVQIGNIIQLSKALGIAKDNRSKMPVVECPSVQHKIDSLLQEIDKLRKSCINNPGATVGDTMKIPKHPKNTGFAAGKWKSTSYIYDVSDGKKVTIYFDINTSGAGTISLVNSDANVCKAPLSLSIDNENLRIIQNHSAECQPPPKSYNPYKFICKTNKTGCAECEAENQLNSKNSFSFNLVKIN